MRRKDQSNLRVARQVTRLPNRHNAFVRAQGKYLRAAQQAKSWYSLADCRHVLVNSYACVRQIGSLRKHHYYKLLTGKAPFLLALMADETGWAFFI